MRRRKWTCFAVCVFIALMLFGCNQVTDRQSATENVTTIPSETENTENTNKTFSLDGVQITLPGYFKEESATGIFASFFDEYSVILLHREPFTEHPSLEMYTLEEYGEKLIQARNINAALQKTDGLLCFEYELNVGDGSVKYNYFVVLFKTNSDFWIFEFVSDSREAQAHREEFIQWAKTVKFAD